MTGAHSRLQHHFESLEKQAHASQLGMWIFLATEILLFGGLFVGYALYRYLFSEGFARASHHMVLWIGTVNTFVLITSSLTVALAVHFARAGRGRTAALLLLVSIGFGFAFLGLKGIEYAEHFHRGALPGRFMRDPELAFPGGPVFLTLYFLMSGLHALHVIVGIVVLAAITRLAWRGVFTPEYHTPAEVGGMYWHLVDVVWIFLYPLLYLVQ